MALKVKGDGPEIVWENAKLNPGFSSPVAYQGLLYTIANRGVVTCAEAATGKVLWTHRIEGSFSASPLAAAGRVYFVSEEGTTYVLEAGRENVTLGKLAQLAAALGAGLEIRFAVVPRAEITVPH